MNPKVFLQALVFALIAQSQLVFGKCKLPTYVPVTIREDVPLGELIETGVKDVSEGNILQVTGDGQKYFSPVVVGGKLNLKVTASIHDVPDGDDATISLEMKIMCETNLEDEMTVDITIIPVNDHPPLFTYDSYTADIQEMMAPGFIVPTKTKIIVSDQDGDFGDGDKITVTIQGGNIFDTFELETVDITTTKIRKIEVLLKAKKIVERPTNGYYELDLVSNDNNAINPLTSTAKVKINVNQLDIRDPIFENPKYSGDLYFKENSNGETLVTDDQGRKAVKIESEKLKLESIRPAAIFAFDQDTQINTLLKYELVSSKEKPDWTDNFELENTQLSLVSVNPAFLKEKSINLLIKASQVDDPRRMALAMISLKIHLPESQTPYFTQRVEILRRTQKGEEIYKIEVEDGDDVNVQIEGDEGYVNTVGRSLLLKETIQDDVTHFTLIIKVEGKSKLLPSINKVKVIFDVVTVKTIQKPLFEKKIYKIDIWKDLKIGGLIFKVVPLETGVVLKNIKQSPDTETFKFDETNSELILTKNPTEESYTITIEGQTEDSTDTTEININVIEPKPKPDPLFKMQKQSVEIVSDHQQNVELFKIETNFPGEMSFEYADKTEESVKGLFYLDNKSGELRLTSPLKNEEIQYTIYILGSLASKNGNREEFYEVVIKVLKKMDPPSSFFEKSKYIIDLMSDIKIGEEIYKINAEADVTTKIETTTPNNGKSIFTLSNDGKITLSGALDGKITQYKLKVLGTKEKREERAEVWIDVVQKMDPPPSLFKKSIYSLDLMSDTKQGSMVYNIKTNIDDVKMNIKSSSPENVVPVFTLSPEGQITLNGRLDPIIKQYKLIVTGLSQKRTEETEVHINLIEKLKPASPLFAKSVYRADILSDTEKDEELIEISTNPDKFITIEISSDTPEAIKSLFRIDQTNKLVLNGKLQNGIKEYKLTLEATVDTVSEKAEVLITVVKKLESPIPLFAKSVYRVDIFSDTEKDKELIEIKTILDKNVIMRIINVSPSSAKLLFRLEGNKVILNAALESDTKEYKLVVDGAVDSQKEMVEVFVTVVDKLVPPIPLFKKSIYLLDILSVAESDKQLIAIETNPGKNVIIEILSVFPVSAHSLFKVVGNKIILNGKLTPNVKEYQLKILGTADEQKEKAEVIFEVVSSEDSSLLDQSKDAHLVQVPDGKKIGELVFQIKANEMATFKVVGGDTKYFEVDESDGKVTVAKELNSVYYNLSVMVKSMKNPQKTATAQLLFEVDLKRPLTIVFKKDINQVDVPINTPVKNDFFKLEMVKNSNWKVLLSITGGNHMSLFNVTNDGGISLINQIEADKQYEFEVTATVTEPDDLIDITKVIVHGVDIKRPLTPIFEKSRESVDITECAEKGSVIHTLSATLIKDVRYEVKGGDTNIFQIDPINGEIKLKGNLKKNEKYFLDIEASNDNLKDKTKVIYQVVASEKCFLFTERSSTVVVPPNTLPGTSVHTLETREPKRPVTFEINDGDKTFFAINESNGEIKTIKSLEEMEYVIKVKGTTPTDPVITDTIDIKFHVKNCTTETSLFTKPVFTVEVKSSSNFGDALTLETIKPNGVSARYFLIEDNQDFNLTENGELILTTSPDQLEQYLYFMVIGAEETKTDIHLYSDKQDVPDLKENQALIIVRNHVFLKTNCSREKVSLFTKPVYSIEIDSFTPVNSNLNLESIKPQGISAKYFLKTEGDKFSLNDDGQLILITDPKSLKLPFYFLAVHALDSSGVPGIKNDEALIIIETFTLPSSFVKVMLPDANLQQYVFDIKAISPKGPLVFSVEKNDYFDISEREGQLYPIDDVTNVENIKQRYFNLKVSALRGNLRSEMTVEIIRLNKEEVVVFTAPEVKDLTSLETKLENATSMKIFLLRYELIPKPVNYAFYNYNNYQIRFAVAAFEGHNLSSPYTIEAFDGKTNEIADVVGEGYQTSAYKGYEPVTVYQNQENGGLVAAVSILSVLLGLILVASIGFILFRKYKPHILGKIRSRFQKNKTTERSVNRKSFNKTTYENYGSDLTDSISRGDKSQSHIVNETRFEVTNEPSNIPSVKPDKETIQRADNKLFKEDEREITNHPDSYQNWHPMADNDKPTGSTASISVSVVEKEDATDKTKKESSLQVPVDHHQLAQTAEEIEPDYPEQEEAIKPDAKPRISRVAREDSFGLDLEEEEAQRKELPELPEAFNNDLIDDEDVDTGEPGGTPHVHRKHVEIHVEEDISDDEEEEMIRKMASIPQRKSVVTFSDKTELIP